MVVPSPPEPSLFRPEAVAHQRNRLTGEAMTAAPLPFRAAVLALALLVAAAATILGSASFARRETARGVLVPPQGLVQATATSDGTLERWLAREGDLVHAGDPIAMIRAASGTLVVAGATGTLTLQRVPQGGPVTAGQTVATLWPGGDLVAELYVPGRAAGLIEVGQDVRLRYDAFPFQRFGTGRGTIEAVSGTTLAPEEMAPGLGVDEPAYRVRVALASGSVEAYGGTVRLRPGMTLGADILLERRNVVGWLLDPLRAAGRGM